LASAAQKLSAGAAAAPAVAADLGAQVPVKPENAKGGGGTTARTPGVGSHAVREKEEQEKEDYTLYTHTSGVPVSRSEDEHDLAWLAGAITLGVICICALALALALLAIRARAQREEVQRESTPAPYCAPTPTPHPRPSFALPPL
jgi:hypothetical protein